MSLSMGHGLDWVDPSTHVDRSEILTRPNLNDKLTWEAIIAMESASCSGVDGLK